MSPQAWVEFAILDMLGWIAGQPIGTLLETFNGRTSSTG